MAEPPHVSGSDVPGSPADASDPIADAPLISDLPDAVASFDELWDRLGGRRPAVFLDYDGTLTGLVDDPADATLDDRARRVLREVADEVPTVVVSGRDLEDVRGMVQLDDLAYAGSHGFDMRLGDGTREQYGTEFLGDLDRVESRLRGALAGVDGLRLERKGFAVAVHTRLVDDADVHERVEDVVGDEAAEHPRLRVTGGKDIYEFRPDLDWDKGRALDRLMDVLELDRDHHAPLYVGDDLTDEDGFEALGTDGIGVVVTGTEDRPTAAAFRLDDPEAVCRFLELVRDRVRNWTG